MLKEEKVLFKVAVAGSLIGLLVIFLVSTNMSIEGVPIASITKEQAGEIIKINGEITRVTDTPAIMIVNVKDETGSIKVVMFKDDDVVLKKKQMVEIEGEVTEYNNELEIEAKRMRRV